MQASTENTEKLLKKNNIRLQGLADKMKGDNLVQYLQLTGCIGSGCDIVIKLNPAFWLDRYFEKACSL